MVEVVLDGRLALDEPHVIPSPRSIVSRRSATARAPCEVGDPQPDADERAALARPLGVEERQLAVAGVGADERELVLAVDDVHAEELLAALGDRVAVGDPEGDVVESCRAHAGRCTRTP